MYIVPCLLPAREAESGMAPRPEAFRLLGLTGLVSLPGSSPEGLAPRGGGMGEDEEDAEGVVEPPEASAPEVPMEPRSPGAPSRWDPQGGQASPGGDSALVWGRRPLGCLPSGPCAPGQQVCPPAGPGPTRRPFRQQLSRLPVWAEQLLLLGGGLVSRGQRLCCSGYHPEWCWSPELTLEARLARVDRPASLTPKVQLCTPV